jgi:hypothetical protein
MCRLAAIEIGWTPSMLRDVVMALQVSLGRVPEESVHQTAIAENWRKAHDWLDTVQQLTDQPAKAPQVEQVPPFPLTGQELQALQASIDRIAQARAAASATQVGTTSGHIRGSLGRVMLSAYGLGAVLAGCAAITVIDLTFFKSTRSTWYVGLSLTCALAAIAVWVLHFRRLGSHKALIEDSHPVL